MPEEDKYLQRYFCEISLRDKLSVNENLVVLPEELGISQAKDDHSIAWPREWNFYKDYRSIVLLGPPRQGKTTEFKHQADCVKNGFYLPLREVTDLHNIATGIEEPDKWEAWINTDEQGELFIDSLDEGKIETTYLSKHMVKWIRSLGNPIIKRLRIHLSCREAEWKRFDEDKWNSLFQKNSIQDDSNRNCADDTGVIIIELLNLSQKEIEEYCDHFNVDAKQFISKIPHTLNHLVARPQTLGFLLDDYHKNNSILSQNKQNLLSRVVNYRLEEKNDYYQLDERYNISIDKKLHIAEYYAVTTCLCDREIIASNDCDKKYHVPSGLTDLEEKEKFVFQSNLFNVYKKGQFRFAEPELAEFLSARKLHYLITSNILRIKTALKLLSLTTKAFEPVPKLRGVAVWLAAMNSEFRNELININPGVLLHDYVGALSEQDKLKIWKWLVDNYSDRDWFNDKNWRGHYGVIACETLVPELKRVLDNPQEYGRDIRLIALEIIVQGKIVSLNDCLVSLVKNMDENPLVLKYAARALKKLAPDKVDVLKSWLDWPEEKDKDNELLGYALDVLWPDFIDIDILIAALRPQEEHRIGRYWLFINDLPECLTDKQRAKLLHAFSDELNDSLSNRHRREANENRESSHFLSPPFKPSHNFSKFLLPQIKEWRNKKENVSHILKWLFTYIRAKEYGLFFHSDLDTDKKLDNFILQENDFRHLLFRSYLEELSIKGNKKSTQDYSYPNILYIYGTEKEDLPFWQDTLVQYQDNEQWLIEFIWKYFWQTWNNAGFFQSILDWLVGLTETNLEINRLWNVYNKCFYNEEIQKWRWDEAKEKRQTENSYQEHISYIKNYLPLLREGDEDLLLHLYGYQSYRGNNAVNIRQYCPKAIQEEYGKEVAEAYTEGLQAYWKNKKLPDVMSYYKKNTTPWLILLVLAVVEAWLKNSTKGDWSTITMEMRHTALQAGLSEMNHFPYWYSDLVNYDKEYTWALFMTILLHEDISQSFYPRLANRLIEHRENSLFHQIAFTYLSEHYEVSREVAIALTKTLLANKIEEVKLFKLIDIGMNRLHRGDILEGMIFLAGTWRYCPHLVWMILQKLQLWEGKERAHHFECWLTAIEKIHLHTPKYTWPDWVHEDALIEMLPDLFNTYPPATDPSIGDCNYGEEDVKKRSYRGHLRGDTLKKIAESGSEKARGALQAVLTKEENRANRNYISDALDQWKEAHSQKVWIPLSPRDLWDVIEKDNRPVRNHEELFELTVEVIEDIREQIQGGDTNLKHIFWCENQKDKPRKEETFQIIIFDKIKTHSLWKKIIAGRELEVKDRNKPDIFTACKLPNGETAKVYIEMKRQGHDKILEAINEQLAAKYLIDPESRYGIYLVGWYGISHYKTNTAIKNKLGDIPQTAQALEMSLQIICDQVVREDINIDGIRAIVVDLS